MKIGKLDNTLLQKIVIDRIRFRRPEVLTRPGVGEDCAVIDFGPYSCVLSTDPITASAEKIGALAVQVSCNDIASNGVEPLGILLTVLLPPSITEEEIGVIMGQAAETAAGLGVEIIGGHTEITATVNQPIISATALGRAPAGDPADPPRAVTPGHRILVTKQLALEGTGIIAAERREELAGVLRPDELAEAVSMLDRISVVTEGVLAGRAGFTAMHDITEGGILGAVWELCTLHDMGARILESSIPLAAVTRKIAAHFGLDPLRLISSGSMLIIAAEEDASRLQAMLPEDIALTDLGEVRPREEGIRMVLSTGAAAAISPPGSDEIYRL